MVIGTHMLISWGIANSFKLERKERIFVTAAGIIPDLDGLGIIVDSLDQNSQFHLKYHHIVGHNLLLGITFAILAYLCCKCKLRVLILTFLCFHVHLLCDLISGRGPDGISWPIYYLPFSPDFELSWSGQWYLHAWPNTVVCLIFIIITFLIARKYKLTPIKCVSESLDQKVLNCFKSVFKKQSKI